MKAPYIRRSDGSVLQGRVVRGDSDWSLTLATCDLTWIGIDHRVSLRFDDVIVSIGDAFTLRSDGRSVELDPGDRAGLGPLLALYPDTLTSGSVTSTGTLTLTLRSGATIEVPPCPVYEAWQVVGPGDHLVVCSPGTDGDLCVWP